MSAALLLMGTAGAAGAAGAMGAAGAADAIGAAGPREVIFLLALFVASVLFLLGLRGLSHPDSARRGMQMAAVGMLVAVLGTLLHERIVTYEWIAGGLVVGTIIGIPMGLWIPM